MPNDNNVSMNHGEIVIYQSEDGSAKIDVRFIDDTVWLTQQQLAKLFKSSRTNIIEHIKHIYEEEELDKQSTCRNFRQVLDLYATSVDYNPKSPESIAFFKMVQNKLHYAAHGHTAAEVIYERADADKPFMGLTSFSGVFPTAKDIVVAKNYLNEEEIKILNALVSGYFDFAEVQAMRHNPMYMSDYVEHLDNVLKSTGEKLLTDSGKVSHAQAMEKARKEYLKFQSQNLSPVEIAYLQTIKSIEKKAKKKEGSP